MKISIQSLLDGARNAERRGGGDRHLRAFTTAAVGPGERRIGVSSWSQRSRKRWRYVRPIAAPFAWGRSEGRRRPASDYGNSPFEIATVESPRRTIIQRTSAGTQGVVAASAGATAFMRPPW